MLPIQINQDFASFRLDKFLCQKFDISFAVAQKLIREKKVKVNSTRQDASYKLEVADEVKIFADLGKRIIREKQKPRISEKKIAEFLSYVVFEDENLIAINKPSGLATQGGSGIEISVDDFLPYLNFCHPEPVEGFLSQKKQSHPQLVHRLDKDTSGILLIAKNSKSAEFLTNAFRSKTISKTYLALVCGVVKKSQGVINIPLRKKITGKNEKVRPDFEEGKESISEYKTLKTFEDYSFLKLTPITGRTHQLRVHCKEIGHAILNDVKYGGREVLRKDLSSRLCLHAYKIELSDYFGKELKIETALPDFLKFARFKAEIL